MKAFFYCREISLAHLPLWHCCLVVGGWYTKKKKMKIVNTCIYQVTILNSDNEHKTTLTAIGFY